MARTVTLGGGGIGAGAAAGGGTFAPVTGKPRTIRGRLGRGFGTGQQPDVFYLWLLLGLEVAATAALRHWSRNHHGG